MKFEHWYKQILVIVLIWCNKLKTYLLWRDKFWIRSELIWTYKIKFPRSRMKKESIEDVPERNGMLKSALYVNARKRRWKLRGKQKCFSSIEMMWMKSVSMPRSMLVQSRKSWKVDCSSDGYIFIYIICDALFESRC